jgi:hypothetical protein
MGIYLRRFLLFKINFGGYEMSYETYHSPSWDWQMSVDHYEGKRYECGYCGVGLDNHEVFLVGGKPFCGCCKDN